MSGVHAPGALLPLRPDQRRASSPEDNIWLSASAGTGKTHVLTARVFRLLLRDGVDPEHIICLTFTKAGAAEMAERIHERLASWVRMPGPQLGRELEAIGADNGPASRERARTLFARVLEARGGGLRIMTIHSFCQTLLASFPEEAGLSALAQPIEERDRRLLAREALRNLVLAEEADGRRTVIEAIQTLSVRMGEENAESFLLKCGERPDAMERLRGDILPVARSLLGLPCDMDADEWLEAQCSDAVIDSAALEAAARGLAAWKAATGQKHAAAIAAWLARAPTERVATLGELHSVWAINEGTPRAVKSGLRKAAPDYETIVAPLFEWTTGLKNSRTLFEYADLFAASLEAGRAFHHHFDAAKRAEGVIDFDDMIRRAAALLQEAEMSAWIRYKLDQRTDHILVDEAQDTNLAQWDILEALSEEFFAGEGARGGRHRTFFTVGDFKQAIFGFQGTSPRFYDQARARFAALGEAAGDAFADLSLATSFRSSAPVLAAVDAVVEKIGHRELGQAKPVPRHVSFHSDRPGTVSLLPPVAHGVVGDDDDEETWVEEEKRFLAHRLADQIADWISGDDPLWLHDEDAPRRARASDFLILVSKRDEFHGLMVANLSARGVPVAGIDRIRLAQPLVVQDLIAAIRFVLQPHDDLNLASLLVSPLMGWSQERLLADGYRPKGSRDSLWQYIRGLEQSADTAAVLLDLLNRADFTTPYQFLEFILSGPIDGRRKLIARLGEAASDPLEELLTTVLAYQGSHVATLQGFVDWFDRGDVEIKRELADARDEVRLMTVHGAKGLEAPVVILANATFNPDARQLGSFDVSFERSDDQFDIPVFGVRSGEKIGVLADHVAHAEKIDREEHWRLLYVAMTRARQHLFVTGSLGSKAKGEVPETSWYAAIRDGLQTLPTETVAHPVWGEVTRHGDPGAAGDSVKVARGPSPATANPDLPRWLTDPAPEEARPPRPLSPSDLGQDDVAHPPPTPAMLDAQRRGTLLHALFERLPDVPPSDRSSRAEAWLRDQRGIEEADERRALVATVETVLDNPEWSDLFAPDALAEAPIAAAVGEVVIGGTVDRLRVTEDHVQLIDFKTSRKVPQRAEYAPPAYLRQMAGYVAALRKIFPGRRVEAGLLYSHAPALLPISDAVLEAHKPRLALDEHSLSPAALEH